MLSTKALTPYGGRLRQYTLSAYTIPMQHIPNWREDCFGRTMSVLLNLPPSHLRVVCCIADFPFKGDETDEAQSDF